MADASNNGKITGTKRFQPGNKLGRGRPAGSRNKVTLAVEKLLEGEAEAITRKAAAMALRGDNTAMRLCMDRIYPVRRGRALPIELPPLSSAENISVAMGAVVEAMARGEISPEEAATIASVIEVKRKAIETGEFERRLAALEQQERS